MKRTLFRSRDDRMLAGVAGGLAELWDVDSSLVRIVWAILVPFTGGFALLVYIVMAIVVPEEDEEAAAYPAGDGSPASATAPPSAGPGGVTADPSPSGRADWRSTQRDARAARRAARRARGGGLSGGTGGVLIGAILVVAGIYFLVREYIPNFDVNWLWPAALIALGVVILLSAFRRPPGDSPDSAARR
jgi:phage shock protein PspC (stress-responsive transcriptional regulator)